MAKRGRSISRGKSRSQSRSRSQRGGSYTSGSTYGSYVNGTPNEQFARTFDVAGPYGARTGSEYVGAQGQWANQPGTPSAQNLALVQSAGRRRSASRGRTARRGRTASRGRTARRGRTASRGRSARRGRTASRGRSATRGRTASRGRSATRGRTASRGRSATSGRTASRGRSRRGGLWGEVINQAIVPLSILGMQQSFRRKKHGGKSRHQKRH